MLCIHTEQTCLTKMADKNQRKITFFVQNTDSSESTVPSTDHIEVPDQAEDNQIILYLR